MVSVLIWFVIGSNGSIATYSQEFKTTAAAELAKERLVTASNAAGHNICAIVSPLEQYK